MTTARELITGSLRLINVVRANQTPNAQDMDISIEALNGLMDSMGNDLLNIYTFSPYRFPLTPGQQTYTLGPATDDSGNPTGANWVIPRPMRIEEAKIMRFATISGSSPNWVITGGPSTLYMPMRKLSVYEYASIRLRSLPNNWPWQYYDDGSYPVRNIDLWPIPQESNAIELWLWEPLADYSTLDDELDLPMGYLRYLRFKLAIELAAEFGKSLHRRL